VGHLRGGPGARRLIAEALNRTISIRGTRQTEPVRGSIRRVCAAQAQSIGCGGVDRASLVWAVRVVRSKVGPACLGAEADRDRGRAWPPDRRRALPSCAASGAALPLLESSAAGSGRCSWRSTSRAPGRIVSRRLLTISSRPGAVAGENHPVVSFAQLQQHLLGFARPNWREPGHLLLPARTLRWSAPPSTAPPRSAASVPRSTSVAR
jgi:hypothetical protein